jgi:hypothetical protein
MEIKIALTNVNRSGEALDDIMQFSNDMDVNLIVMSEPYQKIPRSNQWISSSSLRPSVAVYNKSSDFFALMKLIEKDPDFLVFNWCSIVFCNIYYSPNRSDRYFCAILDKISLVLCVFSDNPIIVLGDFNARYKFWDKGESSNRGAKLYE